MCLCSLVCSANSTLTILDVYNNPMSAVARKAIDLEFVLCLLRNPKVTQVHASDKGFDDRDAIRIGEGLRYVIQLDFICLKYKYTLYRQTVLVCKL
jgi:hypothetical protein